MQLYSKTHRIIFLIFFPAIVAICAYIYGYYNFGAVLSDHATFTLVCAFACYVVIVIYGLYPITIIFTAKKHITEKGYENIAIEFEFIKNLLFVSIPILPISTTTDQLFTYLQLNNY